MKERIARGEPGERKKEICIRFSTPAEREVRERETELLFSASPLVQRLMDLVKR